MANSDYKEIVTKRYDEEAKERKLSLSSTMHDQNTRTLEIQNIIKYINENENCLEVGCGNGAASIEISKIRKLELTSIDANEEMIQFAKQQSTSQIIGKISFRHQDVLALTDKDSFDTVFSVRCIINLIQWIDQQQALKNMANAVKRGGKLILLEAFSDGLEELNKARKEVGLDPVTPAYHNLHLKKELVIPFLENIGFTFFEENNFLSSYYFGSRVIYPALAKANNQDIVKNSRFDSFFSNFKPIGNFAHIKILAFKKKN